MYDFPCFEFFEWSGFTHFHAFTMSWPTSFQYDSSISHSFVFLFTLTEK